MFTDSQIKPYVIDIETTGLDPCSHNITSLCAIEINQDYSVPTVPRLIHVAIEKEPWCYDDPDTIKWREENGVDEMEKGLPKLSMTNALMSLTNLLAPGIPYIFCRHPEFDVSFLQKAYRYYGLTIPWNHKHVYDIGSFMLGAGINCHDDKFRNAFEEYSTWQENKKFHFDGKDLSHDARYDCIRDAYHLHFATHEIIW